VFLTAIYPRRIFEPTLVLIRWNDFGRQAQSGTPLVVWGDGSEDRSTISIEKIEAFCF
jgi:hypothetical protein